MREFSTTKTVQFGFKIISGIPYYAGGAQIYPPPLIFFLLFFLFVYMLNLGFVRLVPQGEDGAPEG